MKKYFSVFLLLVFFASITAQGARNHPAGITQQLLHKLESSLQKGPKFTFARNALANTDAGKLVVDRQKVNSMDHFFSNKIKGHKITNQERSGRCWMFAGLNVLRYAAKCILPIKNIEFSESYLFFYDKLEKANMFLEAVMKMKNKPLSDRYIEFLMNHTTPDGGYWVGLAELVKKYGVVPKDIMPETYSSSHSRTVNRTLDLKLKEYALKIRKASSEEREYKLKVQALKDVYKILAINFGTPPQSFKWRYKDKDGKLTPYKTYTPRQFYKEVVGEPLDDYVALMSVPTKDYGKLYQIDLDKAVYDRPNNTMANVDIETLKDIALKSVLDNTPVWFGCDVGKDSVGKEGLMIPHIYDFDDLYGMKFRLTRKELFETYTDMPTHAMVFAGVDMVNNAPRKWLVENSWGQKFGHNGYYYMADKWFDYYVQVIVVKKKYVPQNILKVFEQKPIVLPPWDPMYKVATLSN